MFYSCAFFFNLSFPFLCYCLPIMPSAVTHTHKHMAVFTHLLIGFAMFCMWSDYYRKCSSCWCVVRLLVDLACLCMRVCL